jgi:cell division protein FtsQ
MAAVGAAAVSGQPGTVPRPSTVDAPAARSRRRWPYPVALAVLLLGALVWVVGFTGVLGVRTVSVTGVRNLSAADIEAAAGVRTGSPLSRVDTGAVADRVRAIPGVERVAVTRSWPATLRIAITERRGIAYAVVGGVPWTVDASGVRFQQLPHPPASLPLLAVRDAGPGDPTTAAALSALTALSPALRARIQAVAADTPDSVTLTLRDHRTVVWGGTADAAAKARVLPALLTRDGTVYDVSTPTVVTVR